MLRIFLWKQKFNPSYDTPYSKTIGVGTPHNIEMQGRLTDGWLAESRFIVPLRGSILQAETCQILSSAKNPRWSPSGATSPIR